MRRRYFSPNTSPTLLKAAVFTALLALSSAACIPTPGAGGKGRCNSPFDCKAGWACIEDKCVKACIVHEDCSAADDACLDGVCVAGARFVCEDALDCVSPGPCTVAKGATCIDFQCSYVQSPDSSPCRNAPCEGGGLCAGSCLGGSCVQCADDSGCDAGYQCAGNRCELRLGLGDWCTGLERGTCAENLKCEVWVCCDAGGPDCCQADSECPNGFACDISVSSCFGVCDPMTAAGCSDPATMFCTGVACAAKSANGSVCTQSEQCVSEHCVEGLCCESACDATCESCTGMLTGQADGSCRSLQARQEDLLPTINCSATGVGCSESACACRGLGTQACAVAVGHPCSAPADCASDTCECADNDCLTKICADAPCGACEYLSGGTCQPGLGATVFISDAKQCVAPFACSAGICLGDIGADCTMPADCEKGLCECAGPQCGTRVCALQKCALCKYTPTGTVCDGDLIPDTTATFACDSGDVYWFDSCGARAALKETCGVAGCAAGNCIVDPITVSPLYPGGGDWNSYILDDGTDAYHASGAICPSTSAGRYPACIHAGEKLKATGLGFDSCAGLSMQDTLGAFNWVCDDTSEGPVVFYSTGLKPGARLESLVGTGSWNTNAVELYSDTAVVHISTASPWWTNAVVPLPTVTPSLSVAGTVYVVDTTVSALTPYTIDAPKISLVIKPGARLLGPVGVAPLVSAYGQPFIWIEGHFANSEPTQPCLDLLAASYAVVRHATLTGCGEGLIVRGGSKQIALSRVHVADTAIGGVKIINSEDILMSDMRINNSGTHGLIADAVTGVTATRIMTSSNTLTGLLVTNADEGIWTFITSANNQQGLSLRNSTAQTVVQLLAVNSKTEALDLQFVEDSTFSQIVLADTWIDMATEVPHLTANTLTNTNFYGVLVIGPGTVNCSVTGGTAPGITDGTCAPSDSSAHTVVPLSAPIPLELAFTGRLSVDDATNVSDTDGKALRASINDWTQFENGYRSWGMDAAYGATGSHGRCLDPGCSIWDWSLSATSSLIRGNSGAGSTPNEPFTDSGTCPSAVSSFRSLPLRDSVGRFLANAYEIQVDGDYSGDGDGLCESFETCAYAPNFGAYQGSGAYSVSDCIFVDDPDPAGVQGVKIHSHEVNGE